MLGRLTSFAMTVSRSAIRSSMDDSIGPTSLVDGCFPPSSDSLLLHISASRFLSLIANWKPRKGDVLEIGSSVHQTLCGFEAVSEDEIVPCSASRAQF